LWLVADQLSRAPGHARRKRTFSAASSCRWKQGLATTRDTANRKRPRRGVSIKSPAGRGRNKPHVAIKRSVSVSAGRRLDGNAFRASVARAPCSQTPACRFWEIVTFDSLTCVICVNPCPLGQKDRSTLLPLLRIVALAPFPHTNFPICDELRQTGDDGESKSVPFKVSLRAPFSSNESEPQA